MLTSPRAVREISGSSILAEQTPPIALGRAMMIFTRPLEKLHRVAAKYRCALIVVGAAALAPLSLAISGPALAANECGPLVGGSVTCTSTPGIPPGTVGNPYPGGISYLQTTPGDLTVNLNSNVNVNVPFSGAQPVAAVSVDNRGGQAILTANGAAITANAFGVTGLGANTDNGSGNAIITASGPIQVGGSGIVAIARGNLASDRASVTYNGPGVTSTGSSATVIQAVNTGAGDAFIDARGNLRGDVVGSGIPNGISGLFATAEDGNAEVRFHSGTITAEGFFANGIFAAGGPVGSATVITDPGTTIIVQIVNPGDKLKPGIAAETTGSAAANDSVTVVAQSAINILGAAAADPNLRNDGLGIRAFSFADAPISVSLLSPGSITTEGGNGIGIAAASVGGSIAVNSSGPITTTNSGAFGILADSGNILNNENMIINNPILTPGGPITVMASGAISTQGAEAHGIWAASTTGPVQVNATNVSTTGQFSTAINAVSTGINGTGGGNVTVNIPSGGSVMGGWQADVTSVGPTFGLPAAGVILNSTGGTAMLTNDGSIGALSDRAIAGDPQVINNGTITGFTQFTGGGNSIENNGTFDLRHFADTNGDGVRDTVRVAIADLGTGANNTFINNGTLALASVTGATHLDNTGQYLPLGNANNAMALGGPLQGHLIGVSSFTNSGVIDLQSNPVPGDVMMITGGRGGSTPGTGGGGMFISNGGSLLLDTVLNEGGAATLSDTLVVDGTTVGGGGATKISVLNAGGAGAETVGDGILVVQVLDPTRSAPGAFALSVPELRAGAFDYDLFHGGVGGSNPADWFLRSTFIPELPGEVVPPGTLPPVTTLPPTPPPNPLPPGVAFPIIGPELATYGVVQPLARQLGLSILGTLDDRRGDTYEPDGCAVAPVVETSGVDLPTKKPAALPTRKGPAPCPLFAPAVWGRFFGQTIHNNYQAFAAPSANGDLGGFQGGIDLLRGPVIPGGYDRAGLYGAYGDVHADVNGIVTNPAATAYVLNRTGSMNLNSWSAGGYWTHTGPGGWYLDAVLQGTWYYGSASTQFARLNTDGTGFIGSLEGGYPFSWPQLGPGFVIEPQGQILWQKVSFRHDYDGLGDVALGDTTGPSGRIGLRTKWTFVTAGGQVWQPYLRGNLWRDWGAEADAVYSGTDLVPLLSQTTRLELGGGLTGRINANVSVFANVDYEFSVGASEGEKRSGVRGAFGATYTW